MSADPPDRPVVWYRPHARHGVGWLSGIRQMIMNIAASRNLIWQLFKRDFFAVYKKSFLGVGWVVLMPVLGILSWVFLQKAGVLRPGDVGIPYPVFVLVGTSMWGLFVGLYDQASQTLEAGKEIIMQIHYPHEALLIKQTAQQISQFVVALALNVAVILLHGMTPHPLGVLLPLVALPLFFLAAGIGLFVAMISVVAVDISRFITLGISLLMYVTPVIHDGKAEQPVLRAVIRWNPLTHLVCSCRDMLLFGRLSDPTAYFWSALFALGVFLLSWRLFFLSEDQLVERMI
ncbi:MAG: ABC transporter permease [Kiritimatiellia bacterium]